MDLPSTLVVSDQGCFPYGADVFAAKNGLFKVGELSSRTDVLPSTTDEGEFNIVLRRQRTRILGKRKIKAIPSRFLNLSDDFEFAGWGSMFRIALSQDELSHGRNRLLELRSQRVLGQFAASALAANDILGGVFYTIPNVFALSGV